MEDVHAAIQSLRALLPLQLQIVTCPLRSLLGTTFYSYTKYGSRSTRLCDVQLQPPELSAQLHVEMHDIFRDGLASHRERCSYDELHLDDG